jgi:hypothetical protein
VRCCNTSPPDSLLLKGQHSYWSMPWNAHLQHELASIPRSTSCPARLQCCGQTLAILATGFSCGSAGCVLELGIESELSVMSLPVLFKWRGDFASVWSDLIGRRSDHNNKS